MATELLPRTTRLAPLLLLLAVSVAVSIVGFVSTGIALEKATHTASPSRLYTTAERPSRFSEDDTTAEYDKQETDDDYDTVKTETTEMPSHNDLSDYECVGWRHTGDCSPDGYREPTRDLACNATIPRGASGYCEYRHRSDRNATKRVLALHCDSLRPRVRLQCDEAPSLLSFGDESLRYTHDAEFSFDKNQRELRQLNHITASTMEMKETFRRGIVMVVYESALVGAYASIRSMREMGCTLPVEIWYNTNETDAHHPLLEDLVTNHGVYRREINDPRAVWFYTKLHALFYSAFDSVLLMDADNFAVQDPTYLFETPEFQATGAIFWPDFWQPSQTIFNIHAQSLVWSVFGLDYVDMFEQESGQVLINRRRHLKAMDTLMFYGFARPRVHEDLRLVWGDKDLFRFAWMKTQSEFHFIARPPGSAGKLDRSTNTFCGVTMVQHDPEGKVVFLHRNTVKLTKDPATQWTQWSYIQQLRPGTSTNNYNVVRSMNIVKDTPKCWGRPKQYNTHYSVRSIERFPFRDLESRVLALAAEGAARLIRRR